MRVLMVQIYKDCPIYVRMIGDDVFIWDVIFKNRLYSSYIVMKPEKGKIKLNKDQITETAKMCYSGAAATIDIQLGEKLNDKDADIVRRFEGARKQIEGSDFGSN